MKIVSWNANGKFREKYAEISKLSADIYIIQECEDPNESTNDAYKNWASHLKWIGDNKNKGLGVFAPLGASLTPLSWNPLSLSLYLKFFLPLRINDSFDLLAIWTQRPYIEEYFAYQQLNKEYYSKNLIIFGDFNSNKKFDSEYASRKQRGHTPTVKDLKSLGLEDGYHWLTKEPQGAETKNTFYLYRHLNRGFHIDHCFIAPEHLKNYEVLDDPKWLKLSDHMPCVLETK